MNFVARHFTGTLLVVVVALGTLLMLAEFSLRSEIEDQTRENLMREARLAVHALPRDSLNWQSAVMAFHEETGLRFTVIDSSALSRVDAIASERWVALTIASTRERAEATRTTPGPARTAT